MSLRSLLAALLCAAILLPSAAPVAARDLKQQISNRQAATQNLAQGAIYRAVHGSQSVAQANDAIGAASAAVTVTTIPLYYMATGASGAYFAGGN